MAVPAAERPQEGLSAGLDSRERDSRPCFERRSRAKEWSRPRSTDPTSPTASSLTGAAAVVSAASIASLGCRRSAQRASTSSASMTIAFAAARTSPRSSLASRPAQLRSCRSCSPSIGVSSPPAAESANARRRESGWLATQPWRAFGLEGAAGGTQTRPDKTKRPICTHERICAPHTLDLLGAGCVLAHLDSLLRLNRPRVALPNICSSLARASAVP
jgi:hypothetical protein